jgi:signal transduction histidine kinase
MSGGHAPSSGADDARRAALLRAQPWGTVLLEPGGTIFEASERARTLLQQPLPRGQRLADALADMIAATTGAADSEALARGVELELENGALWLKAEPAEGIAGVDTVVSVADITPLRRSLDERTTSLRFLLHDLRSPLNSIVALTQLETGDRDTFERCGGMQQIGQLARYVLSLGEQFIVSSIATHLANRDFRRFDLRAMVRQMIPQLEVTAVYCAVPLQLWLPDGAAVWVSGVRNFVARALQNLVDNAIHASPEGAPVAVSLKMRAGFADIVVSDRAGGLPGLTQAQTVTDFDALGKAGASGFGMGLKLARQIVALHGGTLHAESTPGEGTSFVLSMPLLNGAPPAGGAPRSFAQAEQARQQDQRGR